MAGTMVEPLVDSKAVTMVDGMAETKAAMLVVWTAVLLAE
jgi:hypothetical protein